MSLTNVTNIELLGLMGGGHDSLMPLDVAIKVFKKNLLNSLSIESMTKWSIFNHYYFRQVHKIRVHKYFLHDQFNNV